MSERLRPAPTKAFIRFLGLAAVTFGTAGIFALLWDFFAPWINRRYIHGVNDAEGPTRLRWLALDTIDLLANYPLLPMWSVAAFGVFAWLLARPERARPRARLVALAIYLAPLVAVSGLILAAAFTADPMQ